MISCITCDNLNEFGTTYRSQFKLRHQGFVERQQYDVSVYKEMEFDQYDTPAGAYLVYHTDDGEALGVSRVLPRPAARLGRYLPAAAPDRPGAGAEGHRREPAQPEPHAEGTRRLLPRHCRRHLRPRRLPGRVAALGGSNSSGGRSP